MLFEESSWRSLSDVLGTVLAAASKDQLEKSLAERSQE